MTRDPTLSFTFLGTATSSCLPSISCLTDPQNGCECCLSTLNGTTEGQKNVRGNTSGVLRVYNKSKGRFSTILVDCGKSFLTCALRHFPKLGLREIDAVLLTHPHSDAIAGLDDLRGWTLGGIIQPSMDIWVAKDTLAEIARATPYLVYKDQATGGGDVPEFVFKTFETDKPFDVCGVEVTPLPVEHGRFFTENKPFMSLGFMFNRAVTYIADVSHIPPPTWKLLEDTPPPVFIIDCLRVEPHTSHFGLAQAVTSARQSKATRTYLLGFAHRTTHDCWVSCCEAISSGQNAQSPLPTKHEGGLRIKYQDKAYNVKAEKPPTDHAAFTEKALQWIEEWEGGPTKEKTWIRPAYDALTIYVDEKTGQVWDDAY